VVGEKSEGVVRVVEDPSAEKKNGNWDTELEPWQFAGSNVNAH